MVHPWRAHIVRHSQVAAKDRGSGANAIIYVSEDFGENFAESCVPVRHLGDKGYELRETHDRQGVYVLIDHDEEEDVEAAAPVYNLYTCGVANATLFSLSLERVFSVNYYGQRLADWHRVESLPGVFITNQLEIGAMSVETMRERGWKDYVETKVGAGSWRCGLLAWTLSPLYSAQLKQAPLNRLLTEPPYPNSILPQTFATDHLQRRWPLAAPPGAPGLPQPKV